MRPKLSKPLALKDLLAKALQQANSQTPPLEEDLFEILKIKWPEIVGNPFANKSKPIKLQKQRLLVGVSSSVWVQEMDYKKISLLEKVKREIPTLSGLKEIRFKVISLSY